MRWWCRGSTTSPSTAPCRRLGREAEGGIGSRQLLPGFAEYVAGQIHSGDVAPESSESGSLQAEAAAEIQHRRMLRDFHEIGHGLDQKIESVVECGLRRSARVIGRSHWPAERTKNPASKRQRDQVGHWFLVHRGLKRAHRSITEHLLRKCATQELKINPLFVVDRLIRSIHCVTVMEHPLSSSLKGMSR